MTGYERGSRWQIAEVNSARDSRVHQLFAQVFGQPKPPHWWQWKYGQGRGVALGAFRDEELVAHYAGFPRQVIWEGRSISALQVGDVMVKASARGVLTRRGAFQRCAAAFQERYLGYGRPYLLGFGFPTLRVLKLAEALGLYARVDRMTEIQWPFLKDRPRWGSRIRPLDLGRDRPLLVRLWRQMQVDLGDAIVGVRDLEYLVRRYVEHPEHAYQVVVIESRLTRQSRGVIVLRDAQDRCWWIDWVGRPEVLPEAVCWARWLAGRLDRPLCTWASASLAARLEDTEGVLTLLDVYVPTYTWVEGPDPKTLENRWWLMPGDTDFL